jgi:two-component system response regulator RegA
MLKARPKLLIIDDEKDICEHQERIFSKRNFATYSARNKSQAISQALKVLPDIAIIDIHLGKESGIEILKKLRQICPRCKCIIVSWDKQRARQAKKMGALDFLIKPATIEDLLQAVKKATGGLAKK